MIYTSNESEVNTIPRLYDNFTLEDRYFKEDHFGITSYQTARDAMKEIHISEMEEFMANRHYDVISDWIEED